MYIKILFSDEIPGGARRHTARAYIFRPYINTRIIMNARARSRSLRSLSPCMYSILVCSLARLLASERIGAPGRESPLCTRSFLSRSSYALSVHHAVFLLPSVKKVRRRRRRRRGLTRRTIADDGRENDDESGVPAD